MELRLHTMNDKIRDRLRKEQEQQLVEQLRQENPRAFEELYLMYVTPLSQFAFRYVGSEDLAKDIIQNVFFGVWRNRKTLQANGKLRPYLYTAVRNEALNVLRRNSGQAFYDVNIISFIGPSATPEEQLAGSELEQAIQEALQRMPDRRRQIFLMQREDGLTYREIAEVLNISVKTVETQMGRALRFLREYLAEFLPLAGTLAPLLQLLY